MRRQSRRAKTCHEFDEDLVAATLLVQTEYYAEDVDHSTKLCASFMKALMKVVRPQRCGETVYSFNLRTKLVAVVLRVANGGLRTLCFHAM